MDSMEIVYYTCLNNECPKHRNVFMEGDPKHDGCARERLWLEGQSPTTPAWLWFAIPAALLAIAGGILLARSMRPTEGKPPILETQTQTKTWSGAHAHREDREGNAVPPPIS